MKAPETLHQLLARAACFPHTGLRFLDRRERPDWLSWTELHQISQEVGAAIAELGVEPGDRVALVYPTGPGFFHAFFAVLRAGAVPVPLYPPLRFGRQNEYESRTVALLRAAGARLVLASERLQKRFASIAGRAATELGCHRLEELPATAAGAPDAEVSPEALALVQFSSGTTVDPKPVALSHRAVVAQTRILNGFWPDTESVRHSGVSWLPLYHDMGLIGGVFPALERPGVVTLFSPELFAARPAVWLRTLSSYGATISAAPSFAYRLAADNIRDDELEGVDLSGWRLALVGAEPVAPDVLRRFQARFARWGLRPEALTPVYGLAEASLAVTFSDLDRGFETRTFNREALSRGLARAEASGIEITSLGRPVPNFEIKIVDAHDRCATGGVGRVLIRGPSLMSGYLNQPAATARVLRNGWLDTGDLGFVESGELFLTGRAKDVVILRGRNHAPHEIERSTDSVAGIRREGVVAVSHLPEGAPSEVLLLFVERERGTDPQDLARISKACSEAVLTGSGLRVDEVLVLEPGVLPRTSSGKLRRGETLRRYLEGDLVPLRVAADRSPVPKVPPSRLEILHAP